jgi:succinylglutamic semialdehyde dehydrogenase
MSELSNFINGQWTAGHGEQMITVNPADGKRTYT